MSDKPDEKSARNAIQAMLKNVREGGDTLKEFLPAEEIETVRLALEALGNSAQGFLDSYFGPQVMQPYNPSLNSHGRAVHQYRQLLEPLFEEVLKRANGAGNIIRKAQQAVKDIPLYCDQLYYIQVSAHDQSIVKQCQETIARLNEHYEERK